MVSHGTIQDPRAIAGFVHFRETVRARLAVLDVRRFTTAPDRNHGALIQRARLYPFVLTTEIGSGSDHELLIGGRLAAREQRNEYEAKRKEVSHFRRNLARRVPAQESARLRESVNELTVAAVDRRSLTPSNPVHLAYRRDRTAISGGAAYERRRERPLLRRTARTAAAAERRQGGNRSLRRSLERELLFEELHESVRAVSRPRRQPGPAPASATGHANGAGVPWSGMVPVSVIWGIVTEYSVAPTVTF